jgi:hypothetical protein
MSFPLLAQEPVLDMVATIGPWGNTVSMAPNLPQSAAIEAITRTTYYPITVPNGCRLQRFWWANGATAAGNISVAAYLDAGGYPGARISAASAAQAAINDVQFVTPALTPWLTPAAYWIAIASDDAGTTLFQFTFSTTLNAAFKFQEAVGTPPDPAVPVEAGSGNIPLFGFSTVTSP